MSSVLITPFSFIGGNKFYSLRKELNKHNGFIIAFDNVPATYLTAENTESLIQTQPMQLGLL